MFCSFLNLDNDRQQQNWAFLESEKFFNDNIYNIFRGVNTDLIPKFNKCEKLGWDLRRVVEHGLDVINLHFFFKE